MKDRFIEFLEDPNRETYLAVRTMLVESDHYDPYSHELSDVAELFDAGKFEQVMEQLAASMSNLLLSPRAHLMLSLVAEKLDDPQAAELEGYVAVACCEGIQSTGTGSRDDPYLVLRTSDEHDLVEFLGLDFKGQSLIEDANRYLDHIVCEDATELWFDITDPYNKLTEKLGESL